MSDGKREFMGHSVAEAAINACEQFGVNRSDIEYEVISETGEGLDREVLIRAKLKNGVKAGSALESEVPSQEGRDGERGGGVGRGRDARSESGAGRGNRNRRGERNQKPRREAVTHVDECLQLEAVPDKPTELPKAHEGEVSDRAAKALELMTGVRELASFKVELRLVEDSAEQIEIAMYGEDEGKVIGKRGEVLLALQFVLNRMTSRAAEGEQLIVLDAADYRNRRKKALEELAIDLATTAEKKGRIVKLSPMSGNDRRVVHQALSNRNGVNTQSEGEGNFRQLLIIPDGFVKRDRDITARN